MQRTGISNAVAVSTGGRQSLVLAADGSVWASGWNAYSQIGNASTGPAQLSSALAAPGQGIQSSGTHMLTGIDAIAAGWQHTQAAGDIPKEAIPAGSQHSPPLLNGATSKGGINTKTGSFITTHTDIAIPGRGPSPQLERTYNSIDTRTSPLGVGWTHSYNIRLSKPLPGTNPDSDRILVGPQGRSDYYTHSTDGHYVAPPDVYTILVRYPAQHIYIAFLPDQTKWVFDAAGQLIQVVDRYGNAANLTYVDPPNNNQPGLLTTVSDPAGRGVQTFSYNTNSQLTSVTDWAGPARTVRYGYDGSGRLQTVTDRNAAATTYGYDAGGRVQTQTDALNNQTSFAYGAPDGGGNVTTTVTYPVSNFDAIRPTTADSYNADGFTGNANGAQVHGWLTQRVSHPSSTETYTAGYAYDGNGDPASVTDARGNPTTFCWDTDYTGANTAGNVFGTPSGFRGTLTRKIAPAASGGGPNLVTLSQYDINNNQVVVNTNGLPVNDNINNLVQMLPPKGVGNGAGVTCQTNLSGALNTTYDTNAGYDGSKVYLTSVTQRYTDPDTGVQTATTVYGYGDAANPGRMTQIVAPRGDTGGSPDTIYTTNLT